VGSIIAAQAVAATQSLGGEKIVFCIDCFAYSVVVVVAAAAAVVVVFPWLSY